MKIIEERHLVKVNIRYSGTNSYTLDCEGMIKTFYGSVEDLAKMLRRIGASDDKIPPKTNRSMTFMNMAQEITTGKDTKVWIWSNILNKFKGINIKMKNSKVKENEDFLSDKEVLMESKKMLKHNIEESRYIKTKKANFVLDIGDQIIVHPKLTEYGSAMEPDDPEPYYTFNGIYQGKEVKFYVFLTYDKKIYEINAKYWENPNDRFPKGFTGLERDRNVLRQAQQAIRSGKAQYWEESTLKEVEKWSGDVKTKWEPPTGLFKSGNAEEIASKALNGHGGDVGAAIKAINFYKNRGGKNLSSDRKTAMDNAIEILQKKKK